MTYKTRDSPTVIQPRHDHPMLTTACRSTSWAERPPAEVRGRFARLAGERGGAYHGRRSDSHVLVVAARIWPQASHLVDPLAARALFDERHDQDRALLGLASASRFSSDFVQMKASA